MGRFLADTGQVPDHVYTSSARRAVDTVTLAAEAGEWRCPVEVVSDLYDTHEDAVIGFLQTLDDAAESVLLAGHEPTWSSLVSCLTGGSNVRFPTAAIARIDFEIDDWRSVGKGEGRLVWHMPPRPLAKAR
jgi:phosphohistidine phosphatase